MLEFLGAGVLGTITGFFGNIVTGITNYKMQKLKNEHDEKMAEWDIKQLQAESEANIKITKAQAEANIEVAEVDAFKQSYSMLQKDLFDKSYMKSILDRKWLAWLAVPITVMFATVDFLKHLARPALTYYLVGASTWVTILAWKLVGQSMLPLDQSFDLFRTVTLTIIYMTTSIVGWYFGDRRISKFVNRLNDGNAKPK